LAGTPLKAEYTQENLPLVEAGFCNLRKQVVILSKEIEECSGNIVFVLRALNGCLAYVEVVYTLTLPPQQVTDPGFYPGSELFSHPGSNNKKIKEKIN
jgi:hypothetical protein